MSEQKEAWMRIIVGIVSGIVLSVWKFLAIVLSVFHFFYAIFANRRREDIAQLCNIWASQVYIYLRYMTFSSNLRPFPFSSLGKEVNPVDVGRGKKKNSNSSGS